MQFTARFHDQRTDISVSDFDGRRAQSIKSAASGPTVRFFSVTIPTGAVERAIQWEEP
jgi:hypothetical protein